MPRDYVVDLAGVMNDSAQAQLNGLLLELEQKTTAQVVVLTVQSLDGDEIRGFGIKMAEKWKLGQKGKDNGVLIIVAVQDRKYTIEVGYGLEEVLPDSLVGTIGREYLIPYFRKGDYSTGIYAASIAVAQTIAENAGVELSSGRRQPSPATEYVTQLPLSLGQKVLFGIFILGALILFITHPRQCFLLLLFSQMGGGRGGWSGGSGGFGGFGGGGGSFGGGGGGGFGGGGASGSW